MKAIQHLLSVRKRWSTSKLTLQLVTKSLNKLKETHSLRYLMISSRAHSLTTSTFSWREILGPPMARIVPGRASPTDFASAAISAVPALPLTLDQDGPASPEGTAISDSLTLRFAMPGCRTLPADFATAVTSALVVPCQLFNGRP